MIFCNSSYFDNLILFYVLRLCLCLFPCAFLLLMLVSAGLNSVIERTLLAWWQLRQAPTFSPVFGLSTFLMDGAKLFAHAGIPSWIWLHSLRCTLCFLLFCGGFLFRSCWSALLFVHFTWLCLFLLSVVEIFELSLLQMSRNVFVSLTIARCLLVLYSTKLLLASSFCR